MSKTHQINKSYVEKHAPNASKYPRRCGGHIANSQPNKSTNKAWNGGNQIKVDSFLHGQT